MTTTTVIPDRTWRRFFQFRVRTLLLVMLAIAVPLGWKVNQVRRQRALVAAIRELGGSVEYPRWENGPPGPAWARSWLGDDFFDHVSVVGGGYRESNARQILAHAVQFPRLSFLGLKDERTAPVHNEDFAAMGACAGLKELYLSCYEVAGDGWAPLAKLTLLHRLRLEDCLITDAEVAYLSGLPNLHHLELVNTQIHGPGLVQLRGLTKLTSLNLNLTPCSGEGLRALAALPNLRALYLDKTEITDADLEWINELVELRQLTLNDTRVTDAGLDKLTRLTKLYSFGLSSTRVTDDGVARLRARLPNIKQLVHSNDGDSRPERE